VNLVSLIINVCVALVGYILGYRQGKTAQRALDLSVTKAVPKVSTRVRINKRQEESRAFPPSYYLIATIYNEGELPAKQLKGRCKLYSATNDIQEHDIPIETEFLGPSSPLELEAQRIVGTTVDPGMRGDQNIRFNVDIEFEYLGIPDDKPQKYSARYAYDNQSRQLVRVAHS
jgi:hypothetical protein